MKKKAEILAPAGTMDALKAAIANGANAIYLGGNSFGARAYAGNFGKEEMQQAIAYAHERNVKIYVTTNIIVMNSEVEAFLRYVAFLYENDVDALIVQDIGMAHLIKKYFPSMEIHASTQMTAVNSLDTEYLRQVGFERVVYARENSIEELKRIQEKTKMESEAFVHGALCICYSGNCLFSAMTTERSGNRGSCSQPCRMKYQLEKNGNTVEQGYLLSAKDLSTITKAEELLDSGIHSWKIEGRMKRPEYVATVVKNYCDMATNAEKISTKERLSKEDEIRHIFQREYTTGFLLGDENKNIVNPKSPKNKGVLAGNVLYNDKKRKKLGVKLVDDVEVGDGLSTGEKIGRILKGKQICDCAKRGESIELDYIGDLNAGQDIYKTYAKSIMEHAAQSYQKENLHFPISMTLSLYEGQNPILYVCDDEGREVTYVDNMIAERANKAGINEEIAFVQLSKLGEVPYHLEQKNFTLESSRAVFVSKSDLNRFRREAIALLAQKRQKRNTRKGIDVEGIIACWKAERKRMLVGEEMRKKEDRQPFFSVRCRNKEQLFAAKEENVFRVYVDTMELYNFAKTLFAEEQLYFVIPDVVTEKDLDTVTEYLKNFGNRFLTNSPGMAWTYREQNVVGDYLLNLSNSYALKAFPMEQATPSLEWIYGEERQNLQEVFEKENVEIPVYLTPMLMISEYKLSEKHKEKESEHHVERKGLENASKNIWEYDERNTEDEFWLVDQKGNKLFVCSDLFGKTKLFGYEKKELNVAIVELYQEGFSHFRIEFLKEDRNTARQVIKRYKNYLK